ncbi:MAG: alanine racemase, partial [Firmicutes bacterium]|nr:alanine racemase [Bacillota bacterium]
MLLSYIRPVWAEIDLDNLAYNITQIRSFIGQNVKIMAVVKSDAYGAGISGILDTLLEHSVDMLGVALLDEAIAIREKKVRMPVLVFAYTPFEHSDLLVKYEISQTVYCQEQARAISLAAAGLRKKARIHIEIDTGMGRLGFLPTEESINAILEIAKMPY